MGAAVLRPVLLPSLTNWLSVERFLQQCSGHRHNSMRQQSTTASGGRPV